MDINSVNVGDKLFFLCERLDYTPTYEVVVTKIDSQLIYGWCRRADWPFAHYNLLPGTFLKTDIKIVEDPNNA